MHKDWCGNLCAECTLLCKLDELIPCSPDCEHLGPNGETDSEECKRCDARAAENDIDNNIEIACGPNEVKERLWQIIRNAKCEVALRNSDGEVITTFYRPFVDSNAAMLLVDTLIANGVTFKDMEEQHDQA